MSDISQNIADQAEGLRGIGSAKSVKVIAVTAGKGGVGKSNISVNLAVALALKNRKVMLLDADLGLANIDILLGLHGKYNLSHVLKGECHLSDIIIEGPQGIQVIPAASGTEYMAQLSPTEHAGIIDAFNELTDELDYLIIDTAAGISDTVLSFTRSAQELVVVLCDEPTSLTDAYALIKVMSRRYEWKNFHVVANMVRSLRDGRELFNKLYRVSEQFLEVNLNYLGAIPFDERVHEAVKKQQPVLTAFPKAKATAAIMALAEAMIEWPDADLLNGNTSFFLERLITQQRAL